MREEVRKILEETISWCEAGKLLLVSIGEPRDKDPVINISELEEIVYDVRDQGAAYTLDKWKLRLFGK